METNKEKVGFFQEKYNVNSGTRLQMFLTLIFSFLVIGYQVYINENHTPDFLTMVVLFTASTAPKVVSKFAEIKK